MFQVVPRADDHIEVMHAGLVFLGNSPYDFSGGGWNHFDFKTEFSLDRIFLYFPELGAGRNAKNDFAFLFGRFLSLRPFGLPGCLGKR